MSTKTQTKPAVTEGLIALNGLNVTVSRTALASAVEAVFRAASTRSSLPILSHLHFKAVDGSLTVSATDLEVWASKPVPVSGLSYDGAATAPARMFRNILKRLKADDVTIVASIDDNPNATMTEIVTGKARIALYGLPPDGFPLTPMVDGAVITMKATDLRDNIRQVIPAASHDETRAILTGIYTKVSDGNLRMVCTDTHKLIVVDRACSGTVDVEAIIPATTMSILLPLLTGGGDVKVTINSSRITFEVNGAVLTSRLIDGQFPNYERVIPAASTLRYTVNRVALMDTIHTASFIASMNSNRIVLRPHPTEQVLTIGAESGNLGRFSDDIDVDIDGNRIDIAFNAAYLYSVLSVMSTDTVCIGMSDSLRPAVLTQVGIDGWTAIVMPMQVA